MKDEIKEILECLEKYGQLTPDAIDDLHYIRDYINNLQEKYNGIKSNFDIQLEYDEELENKIANLQEELKSANESISWWQNRFNAVEKENENLKIDNKRLQHNGKVFKSRNEKAIEYINNWLFEAGGNGACMDYEDIVEMENILNNGDNK